MNDYIIYLLKVSISTIFLYLLYLLLYSRETFHKRNRFYLIITLILPFIIPFFKMPGLLKINNSIDYLYPGVASIFPGSQIDTNVSQNAVSFSIDNIFLLIYFLIVGVFLLRLVIGFMRTYMIIKKGNKVDRKYPIVVISEMEHPAFSFFPYVVLPKRIYESEDFEDILKHEYTHVRQGHTFDVLLIEIIRAFQWFNPVFYFIKKSIVLNHEYLADDFLIRNSTSIKEYQYRLLNIQTNFQLIPLAHSFSNLIKNRLVMINKKPTSNFATMKNLLILPAISILFISFSFKSVPSPLNSVNQGPLFSVSSDSVISDYLQKRIVYPADAKNSLDTGMVFVVVNMNKGGIVKECKAFTSKSEIDAPVIRKIYIVGYKPSDQKMVKNSEINPSLKTECLRVANRLGEIDIPEWKNRDVKFAVAFHFLLQ